ncbi:MAG TPA: type I-E CRISPR-associated protein Cas5/CasD [Symbiobacteriaceae bacterium]|jgi:CRISPR system Cascade subunit CasD
MKTLLLRLEGPMQSWGTSSRFSERDTGLEPSKSGVIGLLCAALGKPRLEEPTDTDRWPELSRLTSIRMGVRVDRPGKVGVDFQTAGGGRLGHREYGVAKADGSKGESVMSWRYYLQDASFLVGLESGEDDLLQHLQAALKQPVWALSLGRKSYVPSVPVFLRDGLQDGDLETVLGRYPLADQANGEAGGRVRVILDDPRGGEVRADLPLDFARRRFGIRPVRVESIPTPGSTLK